MHSSMTNCNCVTPKNIDTLGFNLISMIMSDLEASDQCMWGNELPNKMV